MSTGEISQLVALVDSDKNGRIDVIELRAALDARSKESTTSIWSRLSKKWL